MAANTAALLHDLGVCEKYALKEPGTDGFQMCSTGVCSGSPSDGIDMTRLVSSPLDAALASASDPSAFLRGVACHGQPYAGARITSPSVGEPTPLEVLSASI